MTNIDRIKIEVEGVTLTDDTLAIYLQENNLTPSDEYAPTSNINKKNIYRTALSILESIANNPSYMRNVKNDDMTISEFSKNLNDRIDSLDRKIRLMSTDDNDNGTGASFVYLFTE